MLDDTNVIPVESITAENQGEPLLRAFEALHADDDRARRIGAAAQHLILDVMHQDNIDRLAHPSCQQEHEMQWKSACCVATATQQVMRGTMRG